MDLTEITRAIETRDLRVAADMETVKAVATETKTAAETVVARMDELEQKMARGGGNGTPVGEESWGAQFVKDFDLSGFSEDYSRRRPRRESLQMKTTLTSASGSGQPLVTAARDDLNGLAKRRMTIRNLLPVISINTYGVQYPQLVTRPTAPAMVAEGTLKPETAISFILKEVGTKVIAHWLPASRQILDDAPQLQGFIDTELRYGLELKEEQQILLGDGTGENLLGLVPQATAYAAPFTVANSTMIDQIGLGILQAALTDFAPDAIVMHPSDWLRMCLVKDAGGNYIVGTPSAVTTKTLWGLPVVTTQAISVDKFLVGSFQSAATIYDRWVPRVEVSTEHADFFVRNLVAILAEERLALAVKNPTALVYGDFGNVP